MQHTNNKELNLIELLLMNLKFIVVLIMLMTVNFCSLILILWKIGVLKMAWFSMLVKLLHLLYLLHEILLVLTLFINCVIILFYFPSVSKILEILRYFHHVIDFTFSKGLKMLGLIRYITSSFSTDHRLLYFVYQSRTIQIGIWICCLELHYINGFVQTRKSSKKICYSRFLVGVCCNNYEGP
jgi:hypothetical protein